MNNRDKRLRNKQQKIIRERIKTLVRDYLEVLYEVIDSDPEIILANNKLRKGFGIFYGGGYVIPPYVQAIWHRSSDERPVDSPMSDETLSEEKKRKAGRLGQLKKRSRVSAVRKNPNLAFNKSDLEMLERMLISLREPHIEQESGTDPKNSGK